MDLLHLPILPERWPDWHVIIIHFPLALFPAAMVLVFIAMVTRRTAQVFSASALVLMLIGMVAAFLAVWTGEEAAHVAEAIARTKPGALEVINAHHDAGELTRSLLAITTAVYGVLFLWHVLKGDQFPRRLRVGLHLVFLGAMSVVMLMMVNTAHLGGRLINEFGIHANIGGFGEQPPAVDAEQEHGQVETED